MQNPLTHLIIRQTSITLYNIQVVLSACQLDEEFMEQPVWRFIYRMLRQIDCGMIESAELRRDPDFHTEALAALTVPYHGKPLTKEQLVEYYLDLKARLFLYLDELDDDLLLQRPKSGKEIRLETIFAELRRFTYQIGQIHAFIALRTGKKPLFFNDDKHYPADHQYFETK
jgi:hypothetical protein